MAQRSILFKTIEDMLRACEIYFNGKYDNHLPLIELSYNNNYRSSISMEPFEALYDRRCRSPVGWFEVGKTSLLGHEIIDDSLDKVWVIMDRIKTTYSQQRSYANNIRRELKFEVGDMVYLKISPMKGVMRFGKKGMLNPWYVGPCEILQRVGKVSYELKLPSELDLLHSIFHVSMLRSVMATPYPFFLLKG